MSRYLTKTARGKLARTAASQAHGKPNTHQIGEAGKVIDELIEADPKRFIDFSNVAYCTPRHEAIITAAAEKLQSQFSLF